MTKTGLFLATFGVCSFVTATAAANSAVIRFKPYGSTTFLTADARSGATAKAGWLPVDDLSLQIEQTLNIGSQSSGAGAGKVTFNPLTITMPPNTLEAALFQMLCSGKAFETVELEILSDNKTVLRLFRFNLIALKSISYTLENKVAYTFEYGAIQLVTPPTGPGKTQPAAGWDRTKNVPVPPDTTIP